MRRAASFPRRKSRAGRWSDTWSLAAARYIERTRKTAARKTNHLIPEALARGDHVAVFPEGTTTAGDRLLRFHAALLQPAIASGGSVHPASLQYFDAVGLRSDAVSYVGDESLIGSVWQLLGAQYVLARLQFDGAEAAAGRHRRVLADTLHATISRRLAFDAPTPAPGTLCDPLAVQR